MTIAASRWCAVPVSLTLLLIGSALPAFGVAAADSRPVIDATHTLGNSFDIEDEWIPKDFTLTPGRWTISVEDLGSAYVCDPTYQGCAADHPQFYRCQYTVVMRPADSEYSFAPVSYETGTNKAADAPPPAKHVKLIRWTKTGRYYVTVTAYVRPGLPPAPQACRVKLTIKKK